MEIAKCWFSRNSSNYHLERFSHLKTSDNWLIEISGDGLRSHILIN